MQNRVDTNELENELRLERRMIIQKSNIILRSNHNKEVPMKTMETRTIGKFEALNEEYADKEGLSVDAYLKKGGACYGLSAEEYRQYCLDDYNEMPMEQFEKKWAVAMKHCKEVMAKKWKSTAKDTNDDDTDEDEE